MAQSNQKMRECAQKLFLARMRILDNNGFYGLLLMHMIYTMDEKCKTVGTDGDRIYFNPEFLLSLTEGELEYVLLHEVLHAALRHTDRRGDFKMDEYDRACDIVVNSNILLSNYMNEKSITLSGKVSEHTAPDGREGHECSVEELYNILLVTECADMNSDGEGKGKGAAKEKDKKDSKDDGERQGGSNSKKAGWDDHGEWGKENTADTDEWTKRICDAAQAIEVRNKSNKRGTVPLFAKRIIEELTNPKTDWRTILNDFIQEEICDYSFYPPDRRFDDSPFFLPDFNEKDEKVKDILFMVDTSGSMGDKEVRNAYSEIKGAIDQFDGNLEGYLGFFDAKVVPPKPFCDEEELKIIHPYGGGGTSFEAIFEYIKKEMSDTTLASIIILTDGYAPFPDESEAMNIPVLWMINNSCVSPPWGKVARI